MNSLLSRLTAFTVRHADHIVTVSEPLRDILVEQFAVPGDKITVRSCGVDMNRFQPIPQSEARQRLGLSPVERIMLFVGTLTDYKGGGDLLTAVTQLAEQGESFHLLMIGDGPLRQQFENQIKAAGLAGQVRFIGSVPNVDMPLWMNAADLFVLPSWREGTPVSLMEALSCERPVVVTHAGGMAKIIQDGENGLLVDIANPAQLAEKLALLLNDIELQQRFSRAGRETVQQWGGLREEVDTLETLYQQLGVPAPEPLS
jgi:glycosyltransferase involved in cell wall biosynthesis